MSTAVALSADHGVTHLSSFRGATQSRARNPEPPEFEMAYYVYLLASKKHGTFYLGVTNDIVRRVYEHRSDAVKGFTSRYGVHKLVRFEIMTTRSRLSPEKRNWDDLYPGIFN
jgi:putative endonuclease